MYCNNCGSKLDLDSNYCTKCGHKLNTPVVENLNKTLKLSENQIKEIRKSFKEEKIVIKKRMPWNLFFSLVFIIVGLGLLLYFAGRQIDDLNLKVSKNIDEPSNSTGTCEYTEEVSSDYSFGVKLEGGEHSSITVLDENDKPVKVNTISNFDEIYVNAPDGGYEVGKTYKIFIQNGTFLNGTFNRYNDVCLKIKDSVETINQEEPAFYIGAYTHYDNIVVLYTDNTFLMTYINDDVKDTIKGTYKIENYVLTLSSEDKTYSFNINNNKEISSLDIIGNSSYSDIGTIYTYKG